MVCVNCNLKFAQNSFIMAEPQPQPQQKPEFHFFKKAISKIPFKEVPKEKQIEINQKAKDLLNNQQIKIFKDAQIGVKCPCCEQFSIGMFSTGDGCCNKHCPMHGKDFKEFNIKLEPQDQIKKCSVCGGLHIETKAEAFLNDQTCH